MINKILIFILISLSLIKADTIEVFSATATKLAMEEIKNTFLKTRPNDKINLHIGAAGKAYSQFQSGMNYDIFFSADKSYPEAIIKDGKGSGELKVYAYGQLTLYSLDENLLKSDLSSLVNQSIKKISIANPRLAPYGLAAIEIIEKQPYYDTIKLKLVLGDNVAQAAHFVDTGAAEIGFIPYALLKNNTNTKGHYVLLDESLYTPLEHCFVVTKFGEDKRLVKDFYSFVLSTEGKQIIEKHGFKAP